MKIILSLLLLLTLSGCATKNEILKMSIQDVSPWVYVGERQGIAEKFITDFNDIEVSKNIQVDLNPSSLDSIKKSLSTGEIDLAVLHNGHKIPSNAVPVLKLANVPLVALTLKTSPETSIEKLRSQKIAYWHEEHDLLSLSDFKDTVPANNHIEGIKMLERGEVSAFISAMHPTNVALGNGQFDQSKFNQPVIVGRHEGWLYLSSRSQHLKSYGAIKEKFASVLTAKDSKPMR